MVSSIFWYLRTAIVVPKALSLPGKEGERRQSEKEMDIVYN
jgi:hypothetical protein